MPVILSAAECACGHCPLQSRLRPKPQCALKPATEHVAGLISPPSHKTAHNVHKPAVATRLGRVCSSLATQQLLQELGTLASNGLQHWHAVLLEAKTQQERPAHTAL